ncbi:MAG TPA: undecaprenyl/decaprenyl-phosphate alpha-N-acetylglucosaminyl 1-phosphate transferase, partial [Patescibacteria group bacterium]|nr:undecaprenyl/decaprenyl-phosphate alpha-N-acetylglucosaminyl 1-phosphate transferase [Patescibacteria group bacterium]
MSYILFFFLAALLAAAIIPFTKRLAFRIGAVNNPGSHPKKIHSRPTPLLGGLGVYLAFLISLLVYLKFGHP